MKRPFCSRGFSLVEVLVVVVILGVVALLSVSVLGGMRKQSEVTTRVSHLRQSTLGVLMMIREENQMLKSWKGGTGGTEGTWSVKVRRFISDPSILYGTPCLRGIQYPASNWYLYTWGINLYDSRAQQSLNNLPDGYQISFNVIDNPAGTLLLGDSIMKSSATAGDTPARQTFRLLGATGIHPSTGSGLRSRDGRTVLISCFDGHVEQADFRALASLGVTRVYDEKGDIIQLPTVQ